MFEVSLVNQQSSLSRLVLHCLIRPEARFQPGHCIQAKRPPGTETWSQQTRKEGRFSTWHGCFASKNVCCGLCLFNWSFVFSFPNWCSKQLLPEFLRGRWNSTKVVTSPNTLCLSVSVFWFESPGFPESWKVRFLFASGIGIALTYCSAAVRIKSFWWAHLASTSMKCTSRQETRRFPWSLWKYQRFWLTNQVSASASLKAKCKSRTGHPPESRIKVFFLGQYKALKNQLEIFLLLILSQSLVRIDTAYLSLQGIISSTVAISDSSEWTMYLLSKIRCLFGV